MYSCSPKKNPMYRYRESVMLGVTSCSRQEVSLSHGMSPPHAASQTPLISPLMSLECVPPVPLHFIAC